MRHGVQHRTTKPYTPKTNGMVERFNGRVQREVLGITLWSHQDLETLLSGFKVAYNGRRQRVLKGRSPDRVLRERLKAKPELAKPVTKPPDPEALPKALKVAARAKEVSHPDTILHAHLVPPCPHADLFSRVGRAWLERQALPDDEHAAIRRHLRELDTLGEDLTVLDRAIGEATLDSPVVRRLLTVTGINVTVAAGLAAAIGDVRRFSSPQKLVSYFGLNPRVRQSGLRLAQHGRISKAGRSHARAMLVEAAWAAAKAPGPLHAFFVRVRARRGHQIAAVATARKLAVLCWHLLTKEADYLWARPGLVANKIRGLELQAGQPQKKGNQRGPAYAYNVKALRDQEMEIARRAETAYERVVAHWTPRPSKTVRGRLKSARLE